MTCLLLQCSRSANTSMLQTTRRASYPEAKLESENEPNFSNRPSKDGVSYYKLRDQMLLREGYRSHTSRSYFDKAFSGFFSSSNAHFFHSLAAFLNVFLTSSFTSFLSHSSSSQFFVSPPVCSGAQPIASKT